MFEAAANKCNVRACFSKRARDAARDASAAAGYEGDVAVKNSINEDVVHTRNESLHSFGAAAAA